VAGASVGSVAARMNLAGRSGRWSAAHWKTAAFGWFVFVFVAFFAGKAIGLNQLGDSQSGSGQTAQAESMLRNAHFLSPATESVLIQSRDGRTLVGDPTFTAASASLVQTLSRRPELTNIREPLLSRDGRRVFAAMTTAYRSLLKKIKRRPAGVFESRVRLSMGSKVVIAAKALASRK